MKVRLKVDPQWLELERRSMTKMRKDYENWATVTLRKAQEATDLRSLREVFYELGDRWEWDQTTGDWLSSGEPLDAVGLILHIPGLEPTKERYVVYFVMAYSKGFTDQFDHLGDKERIIIERDVATGKISCWSTLGHGAMDLFPVDLSKLKSLDRILSSSYLVAQPGDHALRIEVPRYKGDHISIVSLLWEIATGSTRFTSKPIETLSSDDIEGVLDFRFFRYAKAVIELEQIWKEHTGGAVDKAKEAVLDKIPDHIEMRNKNVLRKVENIIHILWFTPPATQLDKIRSFYDELTSEPTPTAVEKELVPFIGEIIYSLNDVLEKAQYLKWKSVMDKKGFGESDIFQGLTLSRMEKEAFAVALDDILREHTLSYIGYPERSTFIDKVIRVIFGFFILPLRLSAKCIDSIGLAIHKKLLSRLKRKKEESSNETAEQSTTSSESSTQESSESLKDDK